MRRLLLLRPDGTAESVYSDRLPLRALGSLSVRRASRVEFNSTSQLWVATDNDGRTIASGPNREEVIRREVEVLEARL